MIKKGLVDKLGKAGFELEYNTYYIQVDQND